MSNWEDIVMSDHDLKWKLNNGNYHIDDLKRGAKAQAEISFKVGIREVVEFVKRIEQSEPSSMSWSFRQRWQSKLKEWGAE